MTNFPSLFNLNFKAQKKVVEDFHLNRAHLLKIIKKPMNYLQIKLHLLHLLSKMGEKVGKIIKVPYALKILLKHYLSLTGKSLFFKNLGLSHSVP